MQRSATVRDSSGFTMLGRRFVRAVRAHPLYAMYVCVGVAAALVDSQVLVVTYVVWTCAILISMYYYWAEFTRAWDRSPDLKAEIPLPNVDRLIWASALTTAQNEVAQAHPVVGPPARRFTTSALVLAFGLLLMIGIGLAAQYVRP